MPKKAWLRWVIVTPLEATAAATATAEAAATAATAARGRID